MKLLLFFILVLLFGYTAYLFAEMVPWWGFAVGAFIVGAVVPVKPSMAFLGGFSGIFILFAILLFKVDMANDSIMSAKMAQVLPLGGSSFSLVLVSSLLGAIVGGLAALSGSFVRKKRHS